MSLDFGSDFGLEKRTVVRAVPSDPPSWKLTQNRNYSPFQISKASVAWSQVGELQNDIPELETSATEFATKYDRSTENAVLDRRKRAMLLSRNVDRVSDVLDLPTLLSSTVSAAQSSTASSSSSTATSYASALDLHAHIKRLGGLYPQSELVGNVSKQAETEIQNLTTILITSLQSPSLKLASAMRTIGWLRRVAPDLADDGYGSAKAHTTSTKNFNLSKASATADGALGSVFLVCRLHTLHNTLDALEPLRDLADQETVRRKQGVTSKLLKQQVSASALGSQSERYLKRYVEIFREQSFSIISMYKSIFPAGLPAPDTGNLSESDMEESSLALPSPLSSFALHLVDLLTATLREYIPNIADKQARESLLTQVLYCAGSLGRLGADFGMRCALLEEEMRAESEVDDRTEGENPEWVQVMKKHRVQASRLEVLARGVGTSRKASGEILSPTILSA
ncbi:hypothetical protein LTR37_020127 [Vermiconidia calcicola]|uniref:Uncharacterized protein n=1 Tax=Vermiconidia calcicola TaxID=1690605 RepID=A0ACC3ME64_9PEZI|nr:hypothetical protein LTR37_020127 [Vermiconidia calcicola]